MLVIIGIAIVLVAVLGVIHTMGSITEPPEVLGGLIGAALVGTFLGVLAAYGFVAPLARAIDAAYSGDTEYFGCMKAAILAHMQGYAPRISIELARKTLSPAVKPNFDELEVAVSGLPSGGG
ncbi:MotA/TolQ/ExbB proton channel family protein [Phaeovibrio sulfidiphilus]|uniref:MotA/TolQ/ExbB proton channel family protein n=1 Tax=Phaeovibrio sulfidiphilus TaxID=1220600 RepID=A0A8J6YPF6_9PROT|nr:MotA/TolQ/ExbB proton channel family protein [Phaeovibrio sulfidiphilus]